MTGQQTRQPVHAKREEYATGSHLAWEAAQHEAEDIYYKTTGKLWEYDFRKRWIEKYFSITPYHEAYEVRICSVCMGERELELFSDPTLKDNVKRIREEVRSISRRLAVKASGKSRHIDRV
jgi:hypothetical protein